VKSAKKCDQGIGLNGSVKKNKSLPCSLREGDDDLSGTKISVVESYVLCASPLCVGRPCVDHADSWLADFPIALGVH